MNKILKSITALILTVGIVLPSVCFNVVHAASIDGWNITLMGGVDADVYVDSEETYSGNGAMRVDIRTPAVGNVYVDITQEVPVEAGKKYYAGVKAKASNATSGNLMVDWGKRYSMTQFGGNYDWTNFQFLYQPQETKNVSLRFVGEGKGTFWMDEFFFIDIETGINLLKNTSFDSGDGTAGVADGAISDENLSNDEIYNRIITSDSFSEDDINRVAGGFKYIPVYPAENIVIDGELSDWDNYEAIEMPTLSNQYQVYMNDGRLMDVKAKCKFSYDDKYLYMSIEAEDDIYHYIYGSGQYWAGDSLQLAISTMNENYGSEIGLAVDPDTGTLDVWGLGNTITPVMAKGSHNDTKTVYEFAYPWDAKFTGLPEQIKFDILVNDNDGDGRRYCAELAPGISEGKLNARFPVLEFVEGEKEWYGWIQATAGTDILTDTEYDFDCYIVNNGDESKKVKITNEMTGDTQTVELNAHSGVRRVIKASFTEEGKFSVGVTMECDGIKSESSINLNVAKPTATIEQTEDAIKNLEKQVKEIKKLIKKCHDKGISTDYEDIHCEILEDFIGYMQEDLNNKTLHRINYTIRETTRIYNEDVEKLNSYLSGSAVPREIPEFVQSKVTFDEVSYWADVKLPDGTIEKRPVFFQGYGHNLDTYKIEGMPLIGGNTTQFEVGPNEAMSTFPSWTITPNNNPEGNYSFDREIYKDGKQSFKVVYTGKETPNVYYTMTQTIKTVPGNSYTLKGWIKAENSESNLSIFPNDWSNGQGYKGTFDWTEVSLGAIASSDTMTVRFIFQGPCDGLWLDSFKFYDNDDPETNLLRNGDFEIGDGEMPVFDMDASKVQLVIANLEAAREANVYVDLGLAPHYFFDDIIKKHDIAITDNVFIKYNVNAPIARKVVESHIREIMNVVKDYQDVVQSICISNEPMFNTRNCGDYYNEQWWQFLRERYNYSIDELNRSYGTSFTDFTQIDQYADQKQPAKNYDYFLFNSDVFADWHKWMADLVHEICPDIPVSSKIFAYVLRRPSNMLRFNVDAEKFVEFCDINGCDAYDFMDDHEELEKEMWYDFMQSLKETPVIDSENHNVPDYDIGWNNYDIGDHMGQDIYTGAVHGRGNAINWILTRNIAGQAPYRPVGMVKMADAMADLNRLAYEITSIQKEPKESAVLYVNSSTLNNDSSLQSIFQSYKAIALNGKIPRFVVESQLEKMKNYKVLIIPELPYAQPKTLDAVADYIKNGGRVIILGKNTLSRTDKNLEADTETRDFIFDNSVVVDWTSSSDSTPDVYVDKLDEAYTNVLREEGLIYAELIDTETGKKAKGVEYLMGVYNGKLIVNVSNVREKNGDHAKLKLYVNGEEITKLFDLRENKEVNGEFQIDAYDVTTFAVDVNNPFFDTYNHWSDAEIAEAYSKGLVAGISPSRFNPQANITRAEFLALTVRACGLDEMNYSGQISDVKSDKWYAKTVATALSSGIIGTEDFRPDAAVTREEMCEILVSAYENAVKKEVDIAEMSFTDNSKIENINTVSKMVVLDVVKGYEDGSFRPAETATRAEATAMINRFSNLK